MRNDDELAAAGYRFEGRVWLEPTAYVAWYRGASGARLVIEATRPSVSDFPSVAPREESPDEFATRLGGGHRMLEGGPFARELVMFDRVEAAAARVATLAAIAGNDHCPQDWFTEECGTWTGWDGGTITQSWNVTNRSSPPTKIGRTSGSHAVVCADRKTWTFRITNSAPEYSVSPESTEVTVQEGSALRVSQLGASRIEEFCDSRFLGICVDTDYRTNYQAWDTSIRALSSVAGREAHFCGRLSHTEDDLYETAGFSGWPCFPHDCDIP